MDVQINVTVKGSGKRLTSDSLSLVYAQLGLSNPDEELRNLLYIYRFSEQRFSKDHRSERWESPYLSTLMGERIQN